MVTDRTGAPMSMFGGPGTAIAFADAAFAGDPGAGSPTGGLIEYSFAEPRFWPDSPELRVDPSIHFRHGAGREGLANVCWLDGHVSVQGFHDTWTSGLYGADPRDFGIGWFGESGDNRDFGYR